MGRALIVSEHAVCERLAESLREVAGWRVDVAAPDDAQEILVAGRDHSAMFFDAESRGLELLTYVRALGVEGRRFLLVDLVDARLLHRATAAGAFLLPRAELDVREVLHTLVTPVSHLAMGLARSPAEAMTDFAMYMGGGLDGGVAFFRACAIETAMSRSGGSVHGAARLLGIPRSRLQQWLRRQ